MPTIMIYFSIATIYVIFLILFQIFFRDLKRFFSLLILTAIAILSVWFIASNINSPSLIPSFLFPLIHGVAIIFASASVVASSVRILNQGDEALVERLGRYHRKLRPGLNFIIPLLDHVVFKDSVRERILNIAKKQAFTKDQFTIEFDAVVFWRVLELELAYYAIKNVENAIEELIINSLRSEIGKIEFNQIASFREELSRVILSIIDEASEPWGIKVTRVEVQEFSLLSNLSERNIISIPFSEGVDWNAFKISLIRVVAENDGIELAVQGIEKTNDGIMIVKVKVPENANKEKIIIDFGKYYGIAEKAIEEKFRSELKGKEGQLEIYRQHKASLERMIEMLASRPIGLSPPSIIEVHASAISGDKNMHNVSDKSQNINVGRDMNLSGSTLNLGEINGMVTNSINQIPTSEPDYTRLKQLLIEIKDTLNNADDTVLSLEDKVDALDQVKLLAEATQLPEQERKVKGGRAIRLLQRIANAIPTSLPIATSLVTEMNKLIPQVASILGIL